MGIINIVVLTDQGRSDAQDMYAILEQETKDHKDGMHALGASQACPLCQENKDAGR